MSNEKPTTPFTSNANKDTWKGKLQVTPLSFGHNEPLTEQELNFVELYVLNGGDANQAAKDAGYEDTKLASRTNLNDARVRTAIELKRDTEIKTMGATRAWSVIEQLMVDPATPAAVKLQAAKWTLEASGHGLSAVAASIQLGMKKAGKKDLSEMSVSELEEFIRKGKDTFDTLKVIVDETKKPPIELK